MVSVSFILFHLVDLGGSAFVKLSTRSPKDAVKKGESLVVNTGSDALRLICKSQRCHQDLGMVERYGNKDDVFSIILREFDTSIDWKWEFRCVVQNDHLVCISQYNCYEVFSCLQDANLLNDIAKQIKEVFSIVHPRLKKKYHEYVIDFAAVLKGIIIISSKIDFNP